MAITKQDLRQIEAKTQDFEQLGLEAGAGLNQIIENIDTDLDFPLKMSSAFPTADSKLYLSNSNLVSSDGSNKTVPPIKRNVYSNIPSLWIDFQASAAARFSDALLFDSILWPSSSTLGNFAYICFTLIKPGKIKIQFTPESATIAGLVNPGKFFTSGGLPVGYLLLQATSTDGKYKTAGSVSSVIENFGVYRFGAGGGGGGGGGDVIEFDIQNNQTTPELIEEMIVDAAENRAFKAEYSVRRVYDADIIEGGNYDNTFTTTGAAQRIGAEISTVDIDSSGNIIAAGTFADYSTDNTARAVAFDSQYNVYQDFCKNAVNGIKFNGDINVIVEQPDGKLLIGGNFTNYAGITGLSYLIRLNLDYSLDTSFNSNAVVSGTTPRLNGQVLTIKLSSDGSIYIGGTFTNYTATGRNYLAKIDSSGNLDLAFMNAAVVNGTTARLTALVRRIDELSDGSVVFGGDFINYTATGRNYLAKVSSLGVVDNTFMTTAVVNGTTARISALVRVVKVLTDNSIIFGGNFINYTATGRNYLAKIDSAGTLDLAFMNAAVVSGTTARISAAVHSVNQLADGSIFFGGDFINYTATGRNCLAKIDILGAIDNIFMNAAVVNGTTARISAAVLDIKQDSSGAIYLAGNFINYSATTDRNRLIKLNTLGTIDTTFQSNIVDGNRFAAQINHILFGQFASNANILFAVGAATYNSRRQYIAKLLPDGRIDHSFALTGAGFNGSITKIEIGAASGKIYAGGLFTAYNAIPRTRVARLNSAGTLDTSFALTGTGLNGDVNTIVVAPDEANVLVCGAFTTYNGLTANRIIRLNSAGAQDTSFVYGTGLNGVARAAVRLSTGGYIVGGDFTTYNTSTLRNRLIKLNFNGSVDTTFTVGTGFDNSVYAMHLCDDGKLFVGGTFTTFNGTSSNRLVKLNSDGTRNVDFNIGTGFNGSVFAILEQEDGKVLVGGDFTSFNGSAVKQLMRLNADGSVDTTFTLESTLTESTTPNIKTINLAIDGDLIASGKFIQTPSVDNHRLLKFNMGTEIEGSELLSAGSFRGIYRSSSSNWELLSFESGGDDTGVTFSIDSSGQMYYTSTEILGTEVESLLKFRVDPL
jgi:uncharacterized delta-60 repeat protein